MRHLFVNTLKNFIARQNHINTCFNVIHHLSPSEADEFLKQLFINRQEGGLAVICADTPFGPLDGRNNNLNFYNEGVQLGLKYAGYGVYSKSSIVYLDDPQKLKIHLAHRVYRPKLRDEEGKKLVMGVSYKGVFPVEEDDLDNAQTLRIDVVDPIDHPLNFLHQDKRAYDFATAHQAKTTFDFNGLNQVMELSGFAVINGWYTDHERDTFYPVGHPDLDKIRIAKVVIVAQKPKKL